MTRTRLFGVAPPQKLTSVLRCNTMLLPNTAGSFTRAATGAAASSITAARQNLFMIFSYFSCCLFPFPYSGDSISTRSH